MAKRNVMTTKEFMDGWNVTAGQNWFARVFWHWVWFTFTMGAPHVDDRR